MAFPLDKVVLISLLVEGVLYGLYTLLFCCTIYVLVHKRFSQRVNIVMLSATVLLFVLATTHLITNLLRLLDAFSLSQVQLGAATTSLDDQRKPINILKLSVLVAQVVTGNLILIYRCYVAWGGSIRIVIPPLLLLLGTAVCCGGVVHSYSKISSLSNVFANPKLHRFVIGTQVLVLMSDVICTCLLAGRIWYMSRAMISRAQRKTLRSVAFIIAQSGLITVLTWIIFIIIYGIRSSAQVIVLDAIVPITGSAFCLIISRVALGMDNDTDPTTNAATNPHSDNPSPVCPVLDGTGLPHRPVEINVSSRHSVRVETEMDALYKESKALAGLSIL